jgi:hypothetical protein
MPQKPTPRPPKPPAPPPAEPLPPAAKLFSEAPEVLGTILHDKDASPRHRIEAARELRATANTGAERTSNTGDSDRFVITINLGGDEKLKFNKRIAPLTPDEAKEGLDVDAE